MSFKFTTKGGQSGKHLKAMIQNHGAYTIPQERVEGKSDWMGLVGNESFSSMLQSNLPEIGFNQRNAVATAIAAANSGEDFNRRATELANIARGMSGNESFSHSLEAGAIARQKAATIDLNARSNQQWPGAEVLYKTVVIPYTEESLSLPIDVAGVGAYNVSGNMHEAWEDLRPIASVLADSKFSSGDDLKLVPVKPSKDTDPNNAAFVSDADWPSWDVVYDANDLLKREAHKTNFLKPAKINNLLNLCRAPGSPAFEQNDEIEAGGITLQRLLIKLKTKTGSINVALNTSNMANRGMRPSSSATSNEQRELKFPVLGESLANFKDKTGKTADQLDLFKALTDLGYTVFLSFDLGMSYHRGTRTLSPTTSPVQIGYLMKDGEKLIPGTAGIPAEVQTLINGLELEGTIIGIETKQNHNNVNRSRYGTTVVYGTVTKFYHVQRRAPISVKYPMTNDDSNADVLARLIKDMDLMITRNMSHDAFKAAAAHFDYVYANNGARIVNINDSSSNVLPGQHFLTMTGIKSQMSLVEDVSTRDSKDTRENISEALVSKIWDVITALRVNSNTAALKELDGRKEEYDIVAHSSLAPFLMTAGDYRTFGQNIKFNIYETNIDSEIGRMYVVPKSQTKDGEIDIFGGIGICVTKELLVIEGSVNQADKQFRMVISQPAYQHHDLCPVIGRVEITDIKDLLGDEGLIAAVNKQLVKVSGKVTTATAGVAKDELPITKID